MFKKTLTFEDFNGEKTTQDFYFHLSKTEMLTLAATDLKSRLDKAMVQKDVEAIMREFHKMVAMACGVRSEDGKLFLKDAYAQQQLMNSPAYDVLMVELMTNQDVAAEFMKQLLPAATLEELVKEVGGGEVAVDPFKDPEKFTDAKDSRPAWMKENREPTQVELREMSPDELRQAFAMRQAREVK